VLLVVALVGAGTVVMTSTTGNGRPGDTTPLSIPKPLSGAGVTIGPSARLAGFSGIGGLNVDLSELSCASPQSCWAVGQPLYGQYGGPQPMNGTLVENWNGSSWKKALSTSADPLDPTAPEIAGLSCPTSNWCMVFGYIGQPALRPFVATLVDGKLTHQEPLPRNGQPTDVWCASPTSCILIRLTIEGRFVTGLWNGTAWTSITSTLPILPSALSCRTIDFCMLVGTATGIANPHSGSAIWNGSTWHVVPTPTPKLKAPNYPPGYSLPVSLPYLVQVSCSNARFCIALGTGNQDFVLRWNARRWTEIRALRASNYSSVSCAPGGACLAVGKAFQDVPAGSATLNAVEIGATTVQSVSPKTLKDTVIGGFGPVACPTTTCMVVGFGQAGFGTAFGGIWNGTAWRDAPFQIARPQLEPPVTATPGFGPCVGSPGSSTVSVQIVQRHAAPGFRGAVLTSLSPQCVIVDKGQKLELVNESSAAATITIGTSYLKGLAAHATMSLEPALSSRLAPGIHFLDVFCGNSNSVIDLWVEPICTDTSTGSNCHTPASSP